MKYGDRILEKIGVSNCKRNEKGFIADCPVCSIEGANKGADKLLISPDGMIHCFRVMTGQDADTKKQHVKDILEALDIRFTEPFFTDTFSNQPNQYTFKISQQPISRDKHKVEVWTDGKAIVIDQIRPISATDRHRVIAAMHLTPPAQQEAKETLTKLCSKVFTYQESQKERKQAQQGFVQLSDGRIAEQTLSGFAVYDPVLREVEFRRSLDDNGTTYQPWQSGVSRGDSGGILLPENVIEYTDTKTLFAELVKYVKTFVDLPEFDAQVTAAYIMFTYLYDKTWELPYLRITGESGSGKSRLTQVVGMACYRPMLVVNPTAASLYRVIEKFNPTLVVDEANMVSGSEDSEALFQVLNAGYQKVNSIPRCEKAKDDGDMEVRLFSAYSPKIITGLTTTDSRAFESRCLQIEMRRTSNLSISFQLSNHLIEEAVRIRGMLTLWRLRHWHEDLDAELLSAEIELKKYDILPRFIQISIPLYAVMKDAELKKNFANLLVERSKADKEDKKMSAEGMLVNIIWDKLFQELNGEFYWRGIDFCSENEPCELLTIEEITKEYNKRMAADNVRNMQSCVQIGRKLKQKLHLAGKSISKRSSKAYKLTAVVFDEARLSYLFNSYGLPFPEKKSLAEEMIQQPENNDLDFNA